MTFKLPEKFRVNRSISTEFELRGGNCDCERRVSKAKREAERVLTSREDD